MPDGPDPMPDAHQHLEGAPCCLDLAPDTACDALDFNYRLTHNTTVVHGDRSIVVPVEVVITARLERCPGPLVQGDLVYATTLLPGEKVRLFTTDRKSQFVYDAATKVSYRNQFASEEQTFLASMSHQLSNFHSRDETTSKTSGGGGGMGLGDVLGAIFTGGLSLIGGSHNGGTTGDFVRELSQHAESSSHRAESATRAASSVSVGETQTRTHTQGESEDHFESSSREFLNPNRCHAITYSFFRVNKTQTIRFTLLSVNREVADPIGRVSIDKVDRAFTGLTATVPHMVLSTDPKRLEQESTDRRSEVMDQTANTMREKVSTGQMNANDAERTKAETERNAQSMSDRELQDGDPRIIANDMSDIAAFAKVVGFGGGGGPTLPSLPAGTSEPAWPWPDPVRQQALDDVAEDLIKHGILDPDSLAVAPGYQKTMSWEKHSSLPTGGVMVKGCLDECDTCEPELGKLYELEVARRSLENQLLEKQIALLEKSHEYRCCPEGEAEPAPTP